MSIRWSKSAYGFQQATFPNQKYRLTALFVDEVVEDGSPRERETRLGRLDVEEHPDGSISFLFGSELAFWPEVHQQLKALDVSPERVREVVDILAEKITPPPEGEPIGMRPVF